MRGVQKEVVKDMTRGERVVGDEAMSGEVVNNKESGEKRLQMWAGRDVR